MRSTRMKVMAVCLGALMLLTALNLQLNMADAQRQNGDQGARVQAVLTILANAKERVQAVLARLEAQGVAIPEEARQRVAEGLAMAEDAVSRFNAGEVGAAGNVAVQAMDRIKRGLEQTGESGLTEEEAQAERAAGLRQAIERATVFVDRIEELAEKAGATHNVSRIEAGITEARTRIAEASQLLEAGNPLDAEKKLGEIHRALAGLIGEAHRLAKAEGVARASRHVEVLNERMARLEEKISSLSLPPQAAERFQTVMDRFNAEAREARDVIRAGSLEAAATRLERLLKDLREALDRAIEGVEVAVNRLEEKLRRLPEDAAGKAKATETLNQVKALIQEARDRLGEDNVTGAQDALNSTVKLISQLTEEVGSAEHGRDRENGPRSQG